MFHFLESFYEWENDWRKFSISLAIYCRPVMFPAEQWKRVGNDFHSLAWRTISPAREFPRKKRRMKIDGKEEWTTNHRGHRNRRGDWILIPLHWYARDVVSKDRIIDFVWQWEQWDVEHHAKSIVDFENQSFHFNTLTKNLASYFASRTNANTPAASGAAADVPECFRVHCPYKSVVATPSKKNKWCYSHEHFLLVR